MNLEDALLCLRMEAGGFDAASASSYCAAAVESGVDLVQVVPDGAGTGLLEGMRDAARAGGALFAVVDRIDLALKLDLRVVHVDDQRKPVPLIRSQMGAGGIVGCSSRTEAELRLLLETEPDYVVHFAGEECPRIFHGVGAWSGIPLFAGGVSTLEAARSVVEGGVYRLCAEVSEADSAALDMLKEFSRILGRSI